MQKYSVKLLIKNISMQNGTNQVITQKVHGLQRKEVQSTLFLEEMYSAKEARKILVNVKTDITLDAITQ